jgi:hypothetical protein
MILVCSYCEKVFNSKPAENTPESDRGICEQCNNQLEASYSQAQVLRQEIEELLLQKQQQEGCIK